ncbi:lipid-binding SYLF domain-containing protein [Desulfocastanea catecholica]
MKRQKLGFTMKRTIQIPIVLLLAIFVLTSPRLSQAATVVEINHDVDGALQSLYQTAPAAKKLAEVAKGILVFPNIIKGGLGIGGQYGEGALRENGKTTGYYKTMAASYGLQAGVQTFGYALFFIDDESLAYLKKSKGWELGVGPSLVVVDKGAATSLTTSTVKSGIYAFIFKQKGLMAGIGIQGSKITKITPDN